MTIRKLTDSDRQQFLTLAGEIQDALPDPLWFIPFSDEELQNLFTTIQGYGVFSEEDELLAFGMLLPIYRDIAESVAENAIGLGGCMVSPRARGQNLMLRINRKLTEVAREQGCREMYAMVHPDNAPSGRWRNSA